MRTRGTVLVTGATGGIGYFVAEQLAGRGHRVLLAARNPGKARAATESIHRHVPAADVEVVRLDLADLASVEAAVARLAVGEPLAGLVANAAVVSYGVRREAPRRTADGFELHLGTAYLGHYALLARLMPRLEEWGTRVVHVGSLSSRMPAGRSPWSHLTDPRPEPTFLSYARSKLAVTLLHHALARGPGPDPTSAAALPDPGAPLLAVASVLVHPGVAVDVQTPARDGIPASQPTGLNPVSRILVRPMQGKDAGAALLVHAAVDPDVRSGEVWGPAGRWQLGGPPTRLTARPPRRAERLTRDLLEVSEALTGLALGPSRA